jgi:inosine-uridine nucleoside N-ribohydrolase
VTGTGRPVVLDCDTGTDDAVAIMLAALHPGLDLLGVTTVWGNLDVGHTTDNTLRVLDHVGRSDVPVHRGAARPLRPAPDPGAGARRLPPHLPLPSTTRAAATTPAAEWLVETLRAATRPVTLVATGPLTNLALALAADHGIVGGVEEVVLMGGSHAVANVTPRAERNVWNDAGAADAVLRAGFPRVVLVTLDATHEATLDRGDCARLRDLGTPAGAATADLVEERIEQYAGAPDPSGRPAAPVHDALAVAHLVDPGILGLRHLHVAVDTSDGPDHGRTAIDVDGGTGRAPNAHVALAADRVRFLDVLLSVLGG